MSAYATSGCAHRQRAVAATGLCCAFSVFEWLGYGEINVEGVQIFVGDQAVQYKAEAFPGQTVEVQIAVRDWAGKGFDLVYRMLDAASGQPITLGKIGIVCVDRQTKRPCAVPDAFKAKVLDLEPMAIIANL